MKPRHDLGNNDAQDRNYGVSDNFVHRCPLLMRSRNSEETLSVSVVSKEQMARAPSLRNSTTTVVNAVGVAQAGQHLQLAALHVCIGQQTLTLGMNDTFSLALIACVVCAVATIFVGRDPALEEARAAKKRGEKGEESSPMTGAPYS